MIVPYGLEENDIGKCFRFHVGGLLRNQSRGLWGRGLQMLGRMTNRNSCPEREKPVSKQSRVVPKGGVLKRGLIFSSLKKRK